MFYRRVIKEEFIIDDIKVSDVVRLRENIFINPENSPRIEVGKKEVKGTHSGVFGEGFFKDSTKERNGNSE